MVVEVEVAVDMVVVVEDMAVAEDSVEGLEEVMAEEEAVVVVAESSLLLSSQDTTLNTEMSLQVEVSPQPPSKLDQTLSHSLFFSDHLRVT
jgi:hypothetical protein